MGFVKKLCFLIFCPVTIHSAHISSILCYFEELKTIEDGIVKGKIDKESYHEVNSCPKRENLFSLIDWPNARSGSMFSRSQTLCISILKERDSMGKVGWKAGEDLGIIGRGKIILLKYTIWDTHKQKFYRKN